MVKSVGQWVTCGLIFIAINTMFFSPIKGCPTLFVLFIVSACCALFWAPLKELRIRRAEITWIGCCLYFAYICFTFLTLGGDAYVAARVMINVLFFLVASVYCQWLSATESDTPFRTAIIYGLFTAIVLSFFQAFLNVWIGHLWLLPLQVQSSPDAYAIQDAGRIYFGDQNKNIWATKVLFAYLLFFGLRDRRWKLLDIVAVAALLFVLIYTVSRTAQLGLVLGCICYVLRRNRGAGLWRRASAIVFACGGLVAITAMSRLSSSDIDLSQGAQGDGLVARLLLWNYLSVNLPGFSTREHFLGHGVFAVANFLNPPFEETNLHNVFLNQYYDFGLVGAVLYCSFLWFAAKNLSSELRWLFIPVLLVVVNSQYLGHDPELMIFYALSALPPCSPTRNEAYANESIAHHHLRE